MKSFAFFLAAIACGLTSPTLNAQITVDLVLFAPVNDDGGTSTISGVISRATALVILQEAAVRETEVVLRTDGARVAASTEITTLPSGPFELWVREAGTWVGFAVTDD